MFFGKKKCWQKKMLAKKINGIKCQARKKGQAKKTLGKTNFWLKVFWGAILLSPLSIVLCNSKQTIVTLQYSNLKH